MNKKLNREQSKYFIQNVGQRRAASRELGGGPGQARPLARVSLLSGTYPTRPYSIAQKMYTEEWRVYQFSYCARRHINVFCKFRSFPTSGVGPQCGPQKHTWTILVHKYKVTKAPFPGCGSQTRHILLFSDSGLCYIPACLIVLA